MISAYREQNSNISLVHNTHFPPFRAVSRTLVSIHAPTHNRLVFVEEFMSCIAVSK